MNGNNGFKSFFIRGLVIMLIAIIFLVVGGTSILGILAAINKVSIADLFKGKAGNRDEITQEQQVTEDEAAGAEVNAGGELLLDELDNAISKVVEKITPSVAN